MISTPQEERVLNVEQKAAVIFGDGPLMIIAGAGTGKTTVVTERIVHLITSGNAKASEILALTFTEKASKEMEERVDQRLPYGVTQLWISTFHGFCDRILRAEGLAIGLDTGYTIFSEAEAMMFFRRHIFSFQLEYYRPLGNPSRFIRGILTHFNRLKDEDVSTSQYLDWCKSKFQISNFKTDEEKQEAEKYLELARTNQKYEELKMKEGFLDYGDLIRLTLHLFRTRPDVLSKYQKQFKYVLIDEFQDTNTAQNELAILLAGKRQNITVVGDDDQAIYRWRGAAISNMIQFRKRFPNVEIIVLTKNYRSTKEILDRSYDMIQNNNPYRLEIAEKIDKKLVSMRKVEGVPIELLYADRVDDEAELVGKKILELVHEKSCAFSDIALLVRANNHAESFMRAFDRMGIPYQFLGPGQLFRQPEVKDIIAYLKVLVNFEDSVAMYRVLSLDVLGILPRDIATLLVTAKKLGISLFESAEQATGISDDGKKKIAMLISLIHSHMGQMQTKSPGHIVYGFLEETGLLARIAQRGTVQEEKRAQHIAAFFDRIKTFENTHEDASVVSMMEWIDLSISLGESPLATTGEWASENAVRILTIHSAKGLEFPHVCIANLVQARFPSIDRSEQIPLPDDLVKEILPEGDIHTQEERRLFYVAMTRARDTLFFTAAKWYSDGKRPKKISPFVVEVLGTGRTEIAEAVRYGGTKQLSMLDIADAEDQSEKQNKKQRRPLSYLSYSQLDTFMTCPLQYKYRYVLRIPVPPSAALVFGSTIHATMQSFYERVMRHESATLQDLLSIYLSRWQSVGYGDVSHEKKMKEHGKELLTGFFEKVFDPTVIPDTLEESFKIKLTPTLTLGGKIDRIDRTSNGDIEIIDYKTGKAPKSKDVRSDLQLTVYALSALQQGERTIEPERVSVSFYFFEGQEKITAHRTNAQVDEAKQTIIQKAEEIATSEFRPSPGKHCEYCEFRLICEAWQ